MSDTINPKPKPDDLNPWSPSYPIPSESLAPHRHLGLSTLLPKIEMAKKIMAESSADGATKKSKNKFADGYFKSTHARDMGVMGRISYQKVINACRGCDTSVSCLNLYLD